MKTNFTLRLFCMYCLFCFPLFEANAQLHNSGFHAFFGVDADTKADYIKYGSTTGFRSSEDWFSTHGGNKGVLDTTGASVYRSLLQQNKNIAFTKRMSAPFFYKSANTMWLDAVYVRDYLKIDSVNIDTTGFVSSAKNAQDPALWIGGPAGVSNKNDLMDVFTHMRRDGTTIKDSLWLFTAASMVGTTGSKYYDVEMFKNKVGYNPSTGSFTSGGPDEGHTQWKFDIRGNVIQTGDLIIAVTYSPGTAPVIEVRLWVARQTFNTVTPTLFNFGTSFDANANNSLFGYASIVSKQGTTAFGSGVGNYASTSTDTTYSTPWGTTGKGWNQDFESLQLVEIGINLTRIGIDPALYTTLGNFAACESFFNSLIYKSRSSASFSSSLNDFVGPVDFMNVPILDHGMKPDTLSCKKTTGVIQVMINNTMGTYTWKNLAGTILTNTTAYGMQLTIDAPGSYILDAALATGCPSGRTDTVIVLTDTLKPVASVATGNYLVGQFQLFGGDPVASNVMTPYGNSQGLTYSWTGPLGFTSILQNPVAFSLGTYELTVTEIRNGCTSMARAYADFSPLSSEAIVLQGNKAPGGVVLKWNHNNSSGARYIIERRLTSGGYQKIGDLSSARGKDTVVSYMDRFPVNGQATYRIAMVLPDGKLRYSNEVIIRDHHAHHSMYVYTEETSGTYFLKAEVPQSSNGTAQLFTTDGRLVKQQALRVERGPQYIQLFNGRDEILKGVYLIRVQLDGRQAISQKIIRQ
jgi:hypothetical protein